jgi:TfoX/Sxy family transcriptional regulator of competence genes
VNASRELAEYDAELVAPNGAVEVKRMFSGAGFAIDGVTFALMSGSASRRWNSWPRRTANDESA